ncbi:sigma-70 family RNA polymerase sigma factor [Asanoa sp. NPDC049518]|uniref:sigma-70 family RNA polymerase sigma factor n=1 Tax=unclassified Asanoa TaxID=2685164 RepID=UPI003430DB68
METVARVAKPGIDAAAGTSFDEFYSANFHRLMLQMYAYTADVGAAQDAVQEAFSRAWARWDRLATYDEPAAWIRRVAMNVANNRWRRARAARAHARYHREEVVAEPSPDRVALARALRSLPERHRRAIVLYHIADLAIAEIAAQEGVTESAVKSWLHRGRAALATLLTEDEEDHHA